VKAVGPGLRLYSLGQFFALTLPPWHALLPQAMALAALGFQRLGLRVARCPVFDRTVQFFGDLSGQKYDTKPDN